MEAHAFVEKIAALAEAAGIESFDDETIDTRWYESLIKFDKTKLKTCQYTKYLPVQLNYGSRWDRALIQIKDEVVAQSARPIEIGVDSQDSNKAKNLEYTIAKYTRNPVLSADKVTPETDENGALVFAGEVNESAYLRAAAWLCYVATTEIEIMLAENYISAKPARKGAAAKSPAPIAVSSATPMLSGLYQTMYSENAPAPYTSQPRSNPVTRIRITWPGKTAWPAATALFRCVENEETAAKQVYRATALIDGNEEPASLLTFHTEICRGYIINAGVVSWEGFTFSKFGISFPAKATQIVYTRVESGGEFNAEEELGELGFELGVVTPAAVPARRRPVVESKCEDTADADTVAHTGFADDISKQLDALSCE